MWQTSCVFVCTAEPTDGAEVVESDEEEKDAGAGADPGLELMASITKELDDESTIDHRAVQVAVSPQVCVHLLFARGRRGPVHR